MNIYRIALYSSSDHELEFDYIKSKNMAIKMAKSWEGQKSETEYVCVFQIPIDEDGNYIYFEQMLIY